MPRSTLGDPPMPGPLARPDDGYPSRSTLAPGQVLAPAAVARGFPTLPELVNALKRRLVLAAFLGMLVGVAAAAAVWLALPNGKHQVKALLEVTAGATNGPRAALGEVEFQAYKDKQQELIKTRMLLERVVASPVVNKLAEIRNSEDPVRYLEESVRVTWPAPELMRVQMNGDDPRQLQKMLDTLLGEYVKDADGLESQGRLREKIRLEEAKARLEREIESREKQLEDVMKQGVGPSPELNAVHGKSLRDQLTEVLAAVGKMERSRPTREAELKAADDKLKQVEAAPVNEDAVLEMLRKVPDYQEKIADVDRAKLRLAETLVNSRPGSPAVLADQEALKRSRNALTAATTEVRPRFVKQAQDDARKAHADEFARLDAKLKADLLQMESEKTNAVKLEQKIDSLNKYALQAINLQKDLQPIKDQRDDINKQLLKHNTWDKFEPRVQIREQATVYLNQNLKQKVLLSIAAMVFGTIALMLAVAFLEWRSRRVDSVEQVISELGLRVIGTIPAFPTKQALKSGDAATSQNWRFVLNESVNSARTMLLHTAKTQNMQVLMVTSAMQGEGKTSLASQLATSMATAGLRTLILDCDLRNPSMHKLFDAPLTPGCSEVLCQEVDVADAVQPTSVPNLWLIPAGQCSNRVISALAQGHPLETLFNRLRGQFDFIVVDSCPVLPVADSLLVGQHVDGVLISILQDISQLPKVQLVSDRLTELNIPLLGAVVNGIKPDIHAYGYNYVKQLPA